MLEKIHRSCQAASLPTCQPAALAGYKIIIDENLEFIIQGKAAG